MAAEKESFKSFLARRKQEYSLQFPFLKENQIVAKLRRLWAGGRSRSVKQRRDLRNSCGSGPSSGYQSFSDDSFTLDQQSTPGAGQVTDKENSFSKSSPILPTPAKKVRVDSPVSPLSPNTNNQQYASPQLKSDSASMLLEHSCIRKHPLHSVDSQVKDSCSPGQSAATPEKKATRTPRRNVSGRALRARSSKRVHWKSPTVLTKEYHLLSPVGLPGAVGGNGTVPGGFGSGESTSPDGIEVSVEEAQELVERLEGTTLSLSPVLKTLPSLRSATPNLDKLLSRRTRRTPLVHTQIPTHLVLNHDENLSSATVSGDGSRLQGHSRIGAIGPIESVDTTEVPLGSTKKEAANQESGDTASRDNQPATSEPSSLRVYGDCEDAKLLTNTGIVVPQSLNQCCKQGSEPSMASQANSFPPQLATLDWSGRSAVSTKDRASEEHLSSGGPSRVTRKRKRESVPGTVRVTRRMAALQKALVEEVGPPLEQSESNLPVPIRNCVSCSEPAASTATEGLPSAQADGRCELDPSTTIVYYVGMSHPHRSLEHSDSISPLHATSTKPGDGEKVENLCPVTKPLLSPVRQNLMCDMFLPLTPERQKYDFYPEQPGDGAVSNRRVFRSAKTEGQSNFYTLFTDEDSIFM